MGVQAGNWLYQHNPTEDHHSVHQSEGWVCSALAGAWLTSRLLLPKAGRQSHLGSITITQQLCVFVEDYTFKRALGGGWGEQCDKLWRCSLKGAKSRGPHPRWPCCVGKSTRTMQQHGWLCCCHLLYVPSLFLCLPNSFLSLHAKALGAKGAAKFKLYNSS